MQTFARDYGHRVKTFDASALTVLHAHRWPGNVRELRNVVERLAIMVPGEVVTARDLGFLFGPGGAPDDPPPLGDLRPLHEARDRFEHDYIVQALAANAGNISRTAEALRVERSNLHRKMRAFGITSPRRTGTMRPRAGGAGFEHLIQLEFVDPESVGARREQRVGRKETHHLGPADFDAERRRFAGDCVEHGLERCAPVVRDVGRHLRDAAMCESDSQCLHPRESPVALPNPPRDAAPRRRRRRWSG